MGRHVLTGVGRPYRHVEDRGPRWVVYGTDRDRFRLIYCDTEAEATEAAQDIDDHHYRTVRTVAPDGQVAPEAIAKRLSDARVELQAATEVARAMAQRMVEQGASEVAVANALGVTRVTVRSWLGK